MTFATRKLLTFILLSTPLHMLIDSCPCLFSNPHLADSVTFCPDDESITLDAGNAGFNFSWSPSGSTAQSVITQTVDLHTVAITNK